MTSRGNKSTPLLSQCKAHLRELNKMILVKQKYKSNIKYAQHSCFAFSENYPKCLRVRFLTWRQQKPIDFCLYCLHKGGEKSTRQFVSPYSEKMELKNFQVTEKVWLIISKLFYNRNESTRKWHLSLASPGDNKGPAYSSHIQKLRVEFEIATGSPVWSWCDHSHESQTRSRGLIAGS